MKVLLFTEKTGFPHGEATSRRIKMLGKAIVDGGADFQLFVLFLNKNKFNKEKKGHYESIPFSYLNAFSNSKSKLVKNIFYFLGVINAIVKVLKQNRKSTIIYIYSHGSIFNLILLLVCKIKRLKVVQEINEWEFTNKKKFYRKWILKGPLIRMSDGAIVISNVISESIDSLPVKNKPKKLIVPILDDIKLYKYESAEGQTDDFKCLWVGQVNGYIKDLEFIIQSLATVHKSGINIKLTIVGRYNQSSLNIIKKSCQTHAFSFSNITLTGYINDIELLDYLKTTSFFIVPLWNDVKSTHRFSTKIAQFMFVGKPLITCNVGDVGRYIKHEQNGLFYTVGDSENLAAEIIKINSDTELVNTLSKNARSTAEKFFHYGRYSKLINDYFNELLTTKN